MMKAKHWFVFILLGAIWSSSFMWIKVAGVDMTSAQPIEDAFEVLGDYVERLESLTGK